MTRTGHQDVSATREDIDDINDRTGRRRHSNKPAI
jgi:hypothetical protein